MTCGALNRLCRRPIVSKDRRKTRPKAKGFGVAGLEGDNDEIRQDRIDSYSHDGSYAGHSGHAVDGVDARVVRTDREIRWGRVFTLHDLLSRYCSWRLGIHRNRLGHACEVSVRFSPYRQMALSVPR